MIQASISHLLFVDDTMLFFFFEKDAMLFFEASLARVEKVKIALNLYDNATG